MHIETTRLWIRPLQAADLPSLVAYRSDPTIARWQSWDASYSLAAAQVLLAGNPASAPLSAGQWRQLAIVRRDDQQMIGDCAMQPHDDGRQVEIGYTLAAGHQGQGYAHEALHGLLDALFQQGVHRIHAACDARNLPSINLLQRLGMRQEGHCRQSYWSKGEWTDDVLFAVLGSEWRGEVL